MDFWQGVEPHEVEALATVLGKRDLIEVVKKDEFLTPNMAAKILFESFYFSQGNVEDQYLLLAALKAVNPNLKINPDNSQEIKDTLKQLVLSYITPRAGSAMAYHDTSAGSSGKVVDDQINEQFGKMSYLFGLNSLDSPEKFYQTILVGNAGETRTPKENLFIICQKIVNNMIVSDRKFLIHKSERPRNGLDGVKTHRADPYLSQICYFIIQENKTPLDCYNKLFSVLKKVLARLVRESADKENPYIQALKELVETYNKHHPENVVDINKI